MLKGEIDFAHALLLIINIVRLFSINLTRQSKSSLKQVAHLPLNQFEKDLFLDIYDLNTNQYIFIKNFIIISKQFQMKVDSAGMLMNELVKRYQISIPYQPKTTTPSNIGRQIPSKREQSISNQVSNLRLKVRQLQEQNRNLKHTMQQQASCLIQKQQNLTALTLKVDECEKKYEEFKTQSNKKTTYLQSHNQALQQELISIKELLREQEALIIQLSSIQQTE